VSIIAASEAFRLLRAAGLPGDPGVGVIAAPLAVIGTLRPSLATGVGIGAIVIIASGMAAFRKSDAKAGFLTWAGSTFGALYVALLAFIPAIVELAPPTDPAAPLAHFFDAGRWWLLVVVLTVWSFDSLAYLVGRTYPRGHFLNHISPNKTWSGVIGGTVAAVVVCAALAWGIAHHPLQGAILGAIIAVTAQAGDVAESLLKRAAGAKDSGTLIPGHGGILDRVDSFLLAAPAAWLYLAVIGIG
ncbi:MAG: phosphatidate cytidylyltransferase, partial [Candidatus Limnocylindrales bacterium]